MHTNKLIEEKSPYLLQHAHNPVEWHAWGDEAFEKARTEDKPIFLSIGYSTCHWCHVMERESFESEEIAEVLNRYFVPVKVDREERPDVDRIYMTFVQATTGGGGWPMSVWLTPDRKPFFGGTYFPPDNRYGRPGFRTVLEHIANAWIGDRDKIVESGSDVVRQLQQMTSARVSGARLEERMLEGCFYSFRRNFDARLGGFGSAPKFPRPVQFNFLLRYWKRTGEDEALDMTLLTLREMYKGGMYDQLGGGFHRYSVDARWFVPHFEKMLYDQAQLAISYVEAFQITGEPLYAQVARETLDYVLRDMTDASGGFYSAEDADSVIDPANPKHKGEGAFYVFSSQEIDAVARQPHNEWFSFRYGALPDGNVEEDPHNEFAGRNILYQAHTIAETARYFSVSEAEVEQAIGKIKRSLLDLRATRVRPHLDDKILTSWNGLMISAFAIAAQALNEPRYAAAATKAANFILATMYNRKKNTLLRRYRDGEAAIAGFLDDYAFFAQGLIDLYEATFDPSLLDTATKLAERMIESFEDTSQGGFYSTMDGDASLVLRLKDDYDGAEPSSNSAAACLLLRLAQLTGNEAIRKAGERTVEAFAARMQNSAITLPQMLVAYMQLISPPRQIVIAGTPNAPDTEALLAERRKRFLPDTVTLLNPDRDGMKPIDGKAAAYVCENFTCKLPVTDPAELAKLLE